MRHLTTLLALVLFATMAVGQDPAFYDSGKPIEPTFGESIPGDPSLSLFGDPINSITTTYASNNMFAGNMFDVEVVGGNPITIEGFAVNLAGGASTISIYFREGSYVGHESTSAGWTLAGAEENVVPQGLNNPTPINIGGIELQAGQVYGFYVTVTSSISAHMNYTNGSAVYSDDHLQITAGIGKGVPDFAGPTFNERIWNGTIYYSINPLQAPLRGWAFWVLGGLITMFILLSNRRVLKA